MDHAAEATVLVDVEVLQVLPPDAGTAADALEEPAPGPPGGPTCLVDCCKQGIAKGSGSVRGFYTRLNMEDVSAQWQRLLLPVLAAASLVFGALSSAGQGRMQDLLWCCSVVLCFSSALVFPLAFSVPFGRLAAQLSRSGAAVAGQYGAADLASSRRIVVTDGDLFPLGSVGINDIKLYGEEQDHALAYAAALAIPAGGAMGRLFEGVAEDEDSRQRPVHRQAHAGLRRHGPGQAHCHMPHEHRRSRQDRLPVDHAAEATSTPTAGPIPWSWTSFWPSPTRPGSRTAPAASSTGRACCPTRPWSPGVTVNLRNEPIIVLFSVWHNWNFLLKKILDRLDKNTPLFLTDPPALRPYSLSTVHTRGSTAIPFATTTPRRSSARSPSPWP